MTLKSVRSGQSWQRLERTQALQGRSGALSRERFQDVCQGHSQDVYPLTVGAWGSSLDSSSLVRQIGKGNSLGENALTIHVSFGFWVHLLQWGHSPIPTFWTEFTERQTLPSLEQAGPAEKMEQDSRFLNQGDWMGSGSCYLWSIFSLQATALVPSRASCILLGWGYLFLEMLHVLHEWSSAGKDSATNLEPSPIFSAYFCDHQKSEDS